MVPAEIFPAERALPPQRPGVGEAKSEIRSARTDRRDTKRKPPPAQTQSPMRLPELPRARQRKPLPWTSITSIIGSIIGSSVIGLLADLCLDRFLGERFLRSYMRSDGLFSLILQPPATQSRAASSQVASAETENCGSASCCITGCRLMGCSCRLRTTAITGERLTRQRT